LNGREIKTGIALRNIKKFSAKNGNAREVLLDRKRESMPTMKVPR